MESEQGVSRECNGLFCSILMIYDGIVFVLLTLLHAPEDDSQKR